jgi:hypothetical protein
MKITTNIVVQMTENEYNALEDKRKFLIEDKEYLINQTVWRHDIRDVVTMHIEKVRFLGEHPTLGYGDINEE